MEFRCEDLPQFGVVLVPPTAPEYDALLADIQKRLDGPVEGSPPPLLGERRGGFERDDTAAILINRSPSGIAAIQQVWTFQEAGGGTHSRSIGGVTGPSVLLPFGLPERFLKLYSYWHVILPGSKRYLNSEGEILGDNTDVRPPGPDEIWTGGIGAGRRGGNRSAGSVAQITLTLDGVFFTDGGFAGPNGFGLWEQVVGRAEAHLQAAQIASRGRDDGLPNDEIFAEIEKLIGPAGKHPPVPALHRSRTPDAVRRYQEQWVAYIIARNRQMAGDDRTVSIVTGWADAPVPRFHRL